MDMCIEYIETGIKEKEKREKEKERKYRRYMKHNSAFGSLKQPKKRRVAEYMR